MRNPAGSGSYVAMGSRQLLTPAPFSLATRGILVDELGRVFLNPAGPGSQNDTSFSVSADNPGMLNSFSVSNGGFATRLETLIDATTAGNPGGAKIRMQSPNVGYGPLNLNDAMSIEAGPNGGKVGIGTSAPVEGFALDVRGGIRSEAEYPALTLFRNPINFSDIAMTSVVGGYSSSAAPGDLVIRNQDLSGIGGRINFLNGFQEAAMTITQENNVGIGTTAPTAGFRFEVNGNIRCTSLTETSSRDLK